MANRFEVNVMTTDYMTAYQIITRGFGRPVYEYTTPEEQGAAIEKCTILEATKIEYSNQTVLSKSESE